MVPKKSSRNDNPFQRRASSDMELLLNIQRELDQLEEVVIDHSVSIPLTRLLVIDKEKLFTQLDLITESVPDTFERAISILKEKEEILMEAEEEAEEIVREAQQRASEILNESLILQQAEREASQLRQEVMEECDNLKRNTTAEVEQLRNKIYEELEALQKKTYQECNTAQNEADDYADEIFHRVEETLSQMLNAVANARQHLNVNDYQPNNSTSIGSNHSNGSRQKSA